MKGFFHRLTLPAKLILIAALPLFFLLFVAIEYSKEKTEKLTMINGYRQRIKLAININTLIDQLQLERRYSFGYTLKDKWQNEMLEQRSRTDNVLRELEDDVNRDLPGFETYTFLNELKEYRQRIDSKIIQPMDAMNFFTNLIFRLNTLNNVAAGNVIYLQPVIRTIAGQKILSDIITYQGMLRAQLYYMLETKQSNPQMIASINQLQNIIDSYNSEFFIKSSPESIRAYNKLKEDHDIQITSEIQRKVRTTNRLDTTVNSEYWWNTSANAIDKIKALQMKMINEGRVGADAIYDKEVQKQRWSWVVLLVVLLFVVVMVVYMIRLISQSLRQLKEAAQQLAVGKTGLSIRPQSNDAIGSLTASILAVDKNSRALSIAAKSIGEGNFDVDVRARSDEDVLGNAIGRMKDNLQQFRKENSERNWLQTGLAQLNDLVIGEKNLETLALKVTKFITEYTGSQVSAFYFSPDQRRLQLLSSIGLNSDRIKKEIEFGETIAGQAALAGKEIFLENVSGVELLVDYSGGTLKPKSIIAVPVYYEKLLKAVIEIGSFADYPAATHEFLKEAGFTIGMAIHSARDHERLQSLYHETQSQAEELQAQHTELENINAELEAQAEKLQASEEELRVQQEELMQANQELEERSRLLEERNQVIVERNLEIRKKAEELEVSTKYKSEFLANMSHELRTPLNSILLLSRLLAENNEQNLSNEQIEYAKVIQGSGHGLLSLIDEILDLSKIEAGKMQLEYAPVGIKEVLEDMQAMFAPVANERGVDFNIRVDKDVPSQIETDKLRLEQVLRNLLSNALKFTSKGSVTLSINKLPENDSFISFSVKDTGIGIPKEKHHLIFEAFQQADGSTRRKFGGTGLGLSISRELTRLLGGDIKLTSEPGKGSEFTIYIPVHKLAVPTQDGDTDEDEEDTMAVPLPIAPVPTYRVDAIPESLPDDRGGVSEKDKVILIIEDDTAFAKALLDFTHSRGYKGLVAVRGDEGIQLAQQHKPVGILLDIQLPVKDGWEVMDELKKNPVTRHIPVHMMSSFEAKRESLLKGAVDFINKPVAFEQMQEVFKKIERVITKENKKVLIVEENPKHAKALAYFLETFDVNAQISNSMTKGVDALKRDDVDCVILDMGIPDQHAYETLENLKKSPGMENLPIIIFTGKNLSKAEEAKIKQYADSIVIKTAHSYKRILDEVSLFLHLVEEHKKPKQESGYKRLGALNEVLAGKKVLVTDDDVRNIFSLTKALEKHDMQVLSAVDGKEALQQLEQHPNTNIVLMDIMMPEMDGYQAMEEIRKKPQFRSLPIIAVTAKAMTGDREKCIKAGASDYISKPVDIDQLLSLLRVWLYDKSN
jgi:signal transduction histidine kinase/DNA-binding response OmpR family regulator/HAMP domain-containing protein